MEITDENERARILAKISKLIDINDYYEINELSFDDYLAKHGSWGDHVSKDIEIRFYDETNVLVQLKKLLNPDDLFYFLPIDGNRKIFKSNDSFLDRYVNGEHYQAHLVVADAKLNWLMIKNNHNKLIGRGGFIRNKIKSRVHLKFDDEKLMYMV